ncbi:GFA family protein [Parasphingorhabdus sp.]|uniref:GFA family protein n=1 Tax=Parasphingorhabdus sp. TaxID=2709688 RepID=UPI003299F298
MLKISGSCHCGAVRFQADVEASPEMLDCNCSICSRSGYLHLFVRHENFTLLEGEADLTSYKFGSGEADHLFCRHCGVKSFYQPRSHPESWSINYKCLDEGHELKPSIRKFDGQNWEASKRAL